MTVYNLIRTSTFCPSQWEGKTEEGDVLYIRFRHGVLTMGVGNDLSDAIDNSIIKYRDNNNNGIMTTDEMLEILDLEVGD